MAGQFVGYVASVLVIGGIGWGLPRWFAWRRSLRRSLNEAGGAGHV